MLIWFLVHNFASFNANARSTCWIKLKNLKKDKIKLVDICLDIESLDFCLWTHEGYKAFVSIMEGCSNIVHFAYLYTRGEEGLVPLDDVLAEIAGLAEKVANELLGQTMVIVYPWRRICTFADLSPCCRNPGIGRLRYTTHIHWNLMTIWSNAIATYHNGFHICTYQQSGSKRCIADKRNHTIDVYIEKLPNCVKFAQKICIYLQISSLSGETDAHFEETLTSDQDLDFDHSYSLYIQKCPGKYP